MTLRIARLLLLVLAGTGLVVGVWALFAPQSFYGSFPGAGRAWVAADGAYNEHLVRDVGALHLGLLAATLVALRRLELTVVRAVGAAWLVFGTAHLAYHLGHLDLYELTDQVLNVVTLGAVVVAAALCLVPWQLPDPDVTSAPPASSFR